MELLIKATNMIGGDNAVKIAKVLKELGRATDDQLASKSGVNLNEVRKILYALHNASLVSIDRARDEKTGWFIFYWRLQPENAEGFIINQKRKILERLQAKLNHEKTHDFYQCPNCKLRMTFENAVESLFQCSHCQGPLEHVDNAQIVKILEDRIGMIRKELS